MHALPQKNIWPSPLSRRNKQHTKIVWLRRVQSHIIHIKKNRKIMSLFDDGGGGGDNNKQCSVLLNWNLMGDSQKYNEIED